MTPQTPIRRPESIHRSRRRFLREMGTTAAALSIVPSHVLGGEGQVAPNSKVNLGFVGVGCQGLRVMLSFLSQPDVQGVAVCDVCEQAADFPQWSRNEFRDGVRKLIGTDSGWEWLSPNEPMITLTRTSRVPSGVAGREPCRKIIEAYNGRTQRSGASRGCGSYTDFRDMLEREKDLDAIVIGTPDHVHAPIAVAAMKKGKHVYCQKPMAHTLQEAVRMGEVARETRVATQVAVGNQASESTRQLIEWYTGGVTGEVREVLNWSSRPFWPQAIDRPSEVQPVPQGLDWSLWLGPAPERPFNHAYLPFVWRGWHDFGCGALGDMGCYSFDTIFRVLNLGAPVAVEASCSTVYPETFPQSSLVHFDFPARGDQPPVRLTWYDGGLKPAGPADLDDGTSLADEGLMFVGNRGTFLCGFTGDNPRLIPEAKMKAFVPPPKRLPRSPGNEREWLDACKGSKSVPGASFEFSSVVTAALMLGNIALRMPGKRLLYDAAHQKITNAPEANRLLHYAYSKGWTL
jgi:predicted dehydrogenase